GQVDERVAREWLAPRRAERRGQQGSADAAGATPGRWRRPRRHRDAGRERRGPERTARGQGRQGHLPGRGGRGPAASAGRRRPVKGFGNMMKEAQKLQAQMLALQEEVGKKKVEATAGGGMVTVEANGKQELTSIKIDPEVLNKADAQMLEDLVLAACNEAL